MELRVHSLLESSKANGPGHRAVIWLQGCSLRCAGCWNPATHARSGGSDFTADELIAWLLSVHSRSEISGITISGGEPLEQAPGLVQLLDDLQRRLPGFSIGLFSGYSEAELTRGSYLCLPSTTVEAKRRLWAQIRQTLDFAVLGRYNALARTNEPLITSKTQRLYLYSDRYLLADFKPQVVEVTIDGQGLTQVTGFPVNGAVTR